MQRYFFFWFSNFYFYNVTSLFTNISLQGTIDIAINLIFNHNPDLNITKKELKKTFYGIIGVHSPPSNRSPLYTKAPGPPLIYLIETLAISDAHINVCVGSPNTFFALKQFNLLPPNTLFWNNFIYYPLKHQFEAITLGSVKNFGITLTESDKLRLES